MPFLSGNIRKFASKPVATVRLLGSLPAGGGVDASRNGEERDALIGLDKSARTEQGATGRWPPAGSRPPVRPYPNQPACTCRKRIKRQGI